VFKNLTNSLALYIKKRRVHYELTIFYLNFKLSAFSLAVLENVIFATVKKIKKENS
jgi:hypothetical protein